MESLLNKENMRKQTAQRAVSVNRKDRRETTSSKYSFTENDPLDKDYIRQLNTEEYLNLLPRKTSVTTTRKFSDELSFNLPEFQSFKSDHIVLIPQIASFPFYDRLRGSSAFSSTKFNRQSIANNSNNNNNNINNNTNNINSQVTSSTAMVSGGSPRPSYSSTKRLSRSRQSQDTAMIYEQQHPQMQIVRPSTARQMSNKFDSVTCFHEVSRLVIFFSSSSDSSSEPKQHSLPRRKKRMTRTNTHI